MADQPFDFRLRQFSVEPDGVPVFVIHMPARNDIGIGSAKIGGKRWIALEVRLERPDLGSEKKRKDSAAHSEGFSELVEGEVARRSGEGEADLSHARSGHARIVARRGPELKLRPPTAPPGRYAVSMIFSRSKRGAALATMR